MHGRGLLASGHRQLLCVGCHDARSHQLFLNPFAVWQICNDGRNFGAGAAVPAIYILFE